MSPSDYLYALNTYTTSGSSATQSGNVTNLDAGQFTVKVPDHNTPVGNGTQWVGVGYTLTDYDGETEGYIIDNGVDQPHGGAGYYPPTAPIVIPTTLSQSFAGDPINTSNGDVMYDETDVTLPNLWHSAHLSPAITTRSTPLTPTTTAAWAMAGPSAIATGWRPAAATRFGSRTAACGLRSPTTPAAIRTRRRIFGTFGQQGSNWVWTDTTGSKVVFRQQREARSGARPLPGRRASLLRR